MRENRSTLEMLGALLGLLILIAVLYVAVGYFRQGATEYEEAERVAGRPVTLAESLSGITATTGLTETAVVTEAAAMTETTATTATTPITETATVTESATTTETTVADTATVTATTDVTTTTDVTATAPVTATDVVTAATAITESVDVTTTPAVTATESVTATEAVTATAATTATSDTASDTAAVAAVPDLSVVEPIVTKGTCFACHVIPGIATAVGQVGPNLSNIGVDGATRIPDYTAEQYIRESLLNPNAFVAPECPTGPCLPNLMVQNLGDTLTAEEIDTLVAYLASLGTTTQ